MGEFLGTGLDQACMDLGLQHNLALDPTQIPNLAPFRILPLTFTIKMSV